MTRAEVDRWTGSRMRKVKAIFGRWVVWPNKKNPHIGLGDYIEFAYVGDWNVNWGFAYRSTGGTIMTPNDWACHPPKRMMEYLERNLPR